MTSSPHLWLALSPHGYGHAAMTAPVVAELRRRRPDLRLTIQTGLPADFLRTAFGDDFTLVPEIPDFGFRMRSSLEIDLEASAAGYAALHADFGAVTAREAERIAAAAPDLVVSNVAYAVLAGAARAGVRGIGFSCLNWADMFARYLRWMPDAARIEAEIRGAYASAEVFLRCTPAQDMTLPNREDVGVVARQGRRRRDELEAALGVPAGTRIGLIAFGGIDHRLPSERWPVIPGWSWINALAEVPERPDMVPWQRPGIPFGDLIPSVDVVVTKVGYGTFTEAGVAGTPVLFVPRPGWPESPHLDDWLANHTRSSPVEPAAFFDGRLPMLLHMVLGQPKPRPARADGIRQVADRIESALVAEWAACGRS
ncbi:MAG: hypothetical protein AB1918_17560 [Pseudomonadota bacterium]